MKIIRNSVWSTKDMVGLNDAIYRVLQLCPEVNSLILYGLDSDKSSRPKFYRIEQFTRGIQEGLIKPSEDPVPVWMLVAEDKIPEKHRARRDKNYALISPLLDDPDFLYNFVINQRSPLLRRYAVDNDLPYSSLKKLLCLCWKYGRGKQSLLPAYAKSGGLGIKKTVKSSPIGRMKKGRVLADGRAQIYIMQESDSKNIKKVLVRNYLKPNGKSLRACWRLFLGIYFPNITTMTTKNTAPYPSYTQFRYCARQLFSLDEIARRRTTEREFLRNKRALLGSSANINTLPGEFYEIDATVADVHLISEFGGKLIGRPTIYLITDRATRMITGMHVSYLYASWRAAAQALANCFLPKQPYCKIFGVNDISNTRWPCNHVPVRLVCDNAEMLGLKSQNTVVPFTELQFVPSYRPDLKNIVESRFGILNREKIHSLMGTTRGGSLVRGEEDPKARACYTLRQFTEFMIRVVDEYNHALNEELLYINPLLLKNDIAATPVNSWNVSINALRFSGYKVTEQEVISRLLYADEASITGKGIQYFNRYYTCSVTEMIRARNFGVTRCDVRIDDNCMDNIYVQFGKNMPFVQSTLLSRRNIFRGLPHMEADIVADICDIQRERYVITPESIAMQEYNKKLEQEGKASLADLKTQGKGRLKNMRENRRQELYHAQRGAPVSSEEEYLLPLANNIHLLPGPEARKEWLEKRNAPDKKGK